MCVYVAHVAALCVCVCERERGCEYVSERVCMGEGGGGGRAGGCWCPASMCPNIVPLCVCVCVLVIDIGRERESLCVYETLYLHIVPLCVYVCVGGCI